MDSYDTPYKRRDAHAETAHFGEFEAAHPELLDGEPDVTRSDVESVSDVELRTATRNLLESGSSRRRPRDPPAVDFGD